jgi:RNA polymerase sigma-70 factor (ECF subfamily)
VVSGQLCGDGETMVERAAWPGDTALSAGDSDDALVTRVLAGDRAAFAGLVERHQKPVYRLAYRLLGNADDADDAAQETFVRAYVHLARYRPGSSLRTWLLAIAGNWCLDQLRRRTVDRRRIVRLEAVEETLEARDDSPESRLLHAESRSAFRRRFAALPDHYRQVLALRYEQDLSYSEIGDALASPVSTVRMRLFRARQQLTRGANAGTFATGDDNTAPA